MTQPGASIYPQPGWWVRSNRVGVNTGLGFGWAANAIGTTTPKGDGTAGFGWSGAAHGVGKQVAFDAVGAGSHPTTASSSISWSHTIAAGAYVLTFSETAGTYTGATFGGGTMTNLTANTTGTTAFGISGATTGANTAAVGNTTSSNTIAGNSVSYLKVASTGTLITASGTSSTASATLTRPPGGMVAAIIFANAHIATITGGTTRWNVTAGSTSANGLAIVDTTTTTTISASLSASVPWIIYGIPLSPT